ncbi:MAG: M23 family metallopeptidase [Bacilli bacterium]|nr:M23 family metallopeptidase [Bacilli bacterium]
MKKRKLRGYVLPTLYLIIIAAVFVGVNVFGKSLKTISYDSYDFVMSAFKNNVVSVVKDEDDTIIKPFASDKVEVAKGYYDISADDKQQQNALIYYEKTYMENTGILYKAQEKFDALATMDGTIKDIKEDEILGIVVEVQNSSKVTTIYYSLSELNVAIGDSVKKGDVIGISGTNKLESQESNVMLFEVYVDGNVVNPEDYYNMKISELK